jgi:hypothetical protein
MLLMFWMLLRKKLFLPLPQELPRQTLLSIYHNQLLLTALLLQQWGW